MLGGQAGLGPAWTRGEIEAPAGEKSVGTSTIGVYTSEQQSRLGVDEFGEMAAAEPEPESQAPNRLEIRAAKMEGMQARADARAAERAAGGGAVQEQGAPQVFIGGSPNFEMRDDLREAQNREVLTALGAADPIAAMDLLAGMGGKIFNLANTVPAELEQEVKDAVTRAVEAAAASLAREPNRSLAQNLIDVAGPGSDEGLMNCNGLANGWVFSNMLTPAAQGMVRNVHERQWGPPRRGVGKDK